MLALCAGVVSAQDRRAAESPEQRAVAYLAAEVASWQPQNHCFSCHNNGDGARALYRASKHSFRVPAQSLTETTRWLSAPQGWTKGLSESPAGDPKLARLQFAAALAEALDAGAVTDRRILNEACSRIAADQQPDGSWHGGESGLGSPATYGKCLATYLARRTLEKSGDTRFAPAIGKADRWLVSAPARSNLDAAAVSMAMEGRSGAEPAAKRRKCVEALLQGQSSDGGWGPYPQTPSEAFDTAITVLALAGAADLTDVARALSRGRAHLLEIQLEAGGWAGTTRPSGSNSYAQHISTTAWAILALLETVRPQDRAATNESTTSRARNRLQ
ncbi:MAG: prenyltransferase/squalene oxidase repeat-containing protein [Bryobacteraceae bacterium]